MNTNSADPLYDKRPINSISKISQALRDGSEQILLKKGEIIDYRGKNDFLYIQKSGLLSLVWDNSKKTEHVVYYWSGNSIIGLVGLLGEQNKNSYYIANTDCVLDFIPVSKARDIIQNKNLWLEVASVLSFYINFYWTHTKIEYGNDSYSAICQVINEIMNYYPESVRSKIKLAKHIHERTGITRSNIMNILSDLKRGGYITTDKGILVSVKVLPPKY